MIESLTALLSPDRVLTGDVHLAAYESDGLTAFRAKPRAVVVPETGEEVVKVVKDDGGEEWVKISLKERQPFLDDNGKPIGEKSEEKPKPKTRRKTTAKKTDAKST